MAKFIFLCFLFCFTVHFSSAQTINKSNNRNALGINVTFLLSQVISVGDNDENDKFNLLYTRYGEKYNFRVGANAKYDKASEFTNLVDQNYKLRLGMDKNVLLSSKFTLMYGLDALGIFSKSVSVADRTGFENIEVKKSYGLGPTLRFEYKLSNRISLMTESTLYFITGNLSQQLRQSGTLQSSTNKNFANLTTTIPSVLYLNIHF